MANCRISRDQVECVIKTGKASPDFEPLKIYDLIEVDNHCECVDMILENVMTPLTEIVLKNLHKQLFAGTVDAQLCRVSAGTYHKATTVINGSKVPPAKEIPTLMSQLISAYKKIPAPALEDILNFHVKLERIAPFDDGNGHLGRLILFTECLRCNVMPFIIDGKRRSRYHQGIQKWDANPEILLEVVAEAQKRYAGQIERQKMKASELRYRKMYDRSHAEKHF